MEKELDTIRHPLMIKTLSPLAIEVVADYIFQKWPQQHAVPPTLCQSLQDSTECKKYCRVTFEARP